MPLPLPTDPELRLVALMMREAGHGGYLLDAACHAAWVSDETMALAGEPTAEELGLGTHVLNALAAPYWAETANSEDLLRILGPFCSWLAGADVREQTIDPLELFESLTGKRLTPDRSPVLSYSVRWRPQAGGESPVRVSWLRLRGADGRFVGAVGLASADVPSEVSFLLSRGDSRALQRMARLAEPRRRSAAILFADVQQSSLLARRLTAAAYFSLVQRFTAAIDTAVVEEGGVIGKHVGDGVTAFFTVEELGSPSAAVRAAIQASQRIQQGLAEATPDGLPTLLANVGLHWDAGVYLGQLVTDGRLEVTALGDSVNQCARLQESARDGAVLVSKVLLEQLVPGDCSMLGVDPDAIVYQPLAELDTVPDKAVRDAGSVPVALLHLDA